MERESLFRSIASSARRFGERPALTFLNASLAPSAYTFRDLLARVDAIAGRLSRSNTGGPIGILLESQESQVLHYLAALSLDLTPAILTPYSRKLNREYYDETMRGVLQRCEFGALVTDVERLDGCTILRPFTLEPASIVNRPRGAALHEAAFLQFSSGTTGIKRGVLVSHDAALAQLRAYGAAIDLHTDDCIVSWLPLYHDMGFVASLHLPLLFGAHAVMMQPADWVIAPTTYLHAMTLYRGTLGWNPNFAYKFMADRARTDELARLDLSRVRGLVNCSEPATAESQRAFIRRFGGCGLRPEVFWGCYAMAETTFALTHGAGTLDQAASAVDAAPAHIPVGRPLPGVDLEVADETGASCPDGIVGELRVRSPFNATGYYNNPDATREAFRRGWYRTGDLGYRTGDLFYVCGRKKDLLIVGGVNVHPNDVEEVVSQVDGVQPGRVVVFGEFDRTLQTERAVVLAEPCAAGDPQEITVRIRQRIVAAFQISPCEVHLVPPRWLVKSSAGKIARNANRDKWRSLRESTAEAEGETRRGLASLKEPGATPGRAEG